MKKLMIFSVALIGFAAVTNAQTDELSLKQDINTLDRQETVLKNVVKKDKANLRKQEDQETTFQGRDQFLRDFGDVPVIEWGRDTDFDKITFLNKGEQTSAYYDTNHELVGTTTNKAFKDLPEAAQRYINKEYPDYRKVGIVYYDDNEYNDTDWMVYGLPVEGEDSYFIELAKGDKGIVLQSDTEGSVTYFEQIH